MANDSFSLDIESIRKRAQQDMGDGPVTETYGKDAQRVIDVLNEVVATEVVCWLRYTQHAIAAEGIHHKSVAAEFTEHAAEERKHMLQAAERVSQLGGQPDLSPESATGRAHTQYATYEEEDLDGMLKENLKAERIVIMTYQEIIRWLGADDPTTRTMLESILAEEEDHADDLNDLLSKDSYQSATWA
jgi:bacterioferritin